MIDLIQNGNALVNSSVVVKKEILFSVDLISEDVDKITWEDYDLWVKIAGVTDAFKRIPKTLGYYSINANNLSDHKREQNNLKAIKKNYMHYLNNVSVPNDTMWWVEYNNCRLNYFLGKYKLAIDSANKVTKIPFKYKIKLKIICLFSRLRMTI